MAGGYRADAVEFSDEESDDILAAATLSRDELLASNPFSLANFSKRKLLYMAAFDVEYWESAMQGLTFATATVNISPEEGQAVQHRFQEAVCKHTNKVTQKDRDSLSSLNKKVTALMAKLQTQSKDETGFFVRLGPRSPKDAPQNITASSLVSEDRLRGLLRACNLITSRDKADPYTMLRCFQDACNGFLRVFTAEEAIALLTHSDRVSQDISRSLAHVTSDSPTWDMSVVVRRWDDEVRMEREFRTFVVGGELAAISQYDDQLSYPFVQAQTENIVRAILQGVQLIKPCLEALDLASCKRAVVVDFLVLPQSSSSNDAGMSAKVVELNPFGPMTGASLFSWTTDRRVLQSGKDLYGDLEAWETQHPPGNVKLPDWVCERIVDGIPFRYNTDHRPGYTIEHLQAFWPDWYRVAVTS